MPCSRCCHCKGSLPGLGRRECCHRGRQGRGPLAFACTARWVSFRALRGHEQGPFRCPVLAPADQCGVHHGRAQGRCGAAGWHAHQHLLGRRGRIWSFVLSTFLGGKVRHYGTSARYYGADTVLCPWAEERVKPPTPVLRAQVDSGRGHPWAAFSMSICIRDDVVKQRVPSMG